MDLATFGAIMSYAIEFEEHFVRFYNDAAKGNLEDVFKEFARSSSKRAKRMERTRREGVTEMILESIIGLDSDDYQAEFSMASDDALLIDQVITLEEIATRFYQDASEKIPIREVARIFMRMAGENKKRKARLEMMAIEMRG